MKSLILIVLYTSALCSIQIASASEGADTFTPAGVLSGSIFTKSLCRVVASSVWVEIDGQGECIRYFAAGFEPDRQNNALVFFHGDRVAHWGPGQSGAFVLRNYSGYSAARLQKHAEVEHDRLGLPYIWISRPGVYGSSGNHHQRRRSRESQLLNQTLSQLKTALGIESYSLAGFSGGGHVVASLLTHRTDIRCAVIASGVVSVKSRIKALGWITDITGHDDYYDPTQNVTDVLPSPDRRVFILAAVEDRRVPYHTQLEYYHALRRHSNHATLVNVQGYGEESKSAGDQLTDATAMCMRGHSDEQIRRAIGLF